MEYRSTCRPWWATAGALAVAGVGLGVGLILLGALRAPVRLEEAHLYAYGARILSARAVGERLDYGQMPIAALYALPGQVLGEHLSVQTGRFVSILWYAALCGVAWRWGETLYGPRGGAAAAVLTAFFPAFLAQGSVMTVEMSAAAAMTAAVYALARCLWDPTLGGAFLAGTLIGVALLTKYVTIVLFPISLLLIICRAVTAERMECSTRVVRGSVAATFVAWLVAVLVLDAGFMFRRVGTTLAWLDCQSRLFQLLRTAFGTLVLPVPRDYLVGLDRILAPPAPEQGLVYLVGERSVEVFEAASLWAILVLLGLLVVLRRWRRERRYSDAVLSVPVIWLVLSFGVLSHPRVAARFLLLAVPFLAVLAAGVWERGGPAALEKTAGWLLLLQVAVVTTFWFMLGT